MTILQNKKNRVIIITLFFFIVVIITYLVIASILVYSRNAWNEEFTQMLLEHPYAIELLHTMGNERSIEEYLQHLSSTLIGGRVGAITVILEESDIFVYRNGHLVMIKAFANE